MLRRVAVQAHDVDPRTVAAYLGGLNVRPATAARIAAALAALGIRDPRAAHEGVGRE
jgi:hypothetical protein